MQEIWVPGLRRSPGVGNDNPLQFLTWKIPWTEELGAQWVTVQGVAKSQTWLSISTSNYYKICQKPWEASGTDWTKSDSNSLPLEFFDFISLCGWVRPLFLTYLSDCSFHHYFSRSLNSRTSDFILLIFFYIFYWQNSVYNNEYFLVIWF